MSFAFLCVATAAVFVLDSDGVMLTNTNTPDGYQAITTETISDDELLEMAKSQPSIIDMDFKLAKNYNITVFPMENLKDN